MHFTCIIYFHTLKIFYKTLFLVLINENLIELQKLIVYLIAILIV